MNTKSKSPAVKYLEKISSGPLTLGKVLRSYRLAEEMTQEEVAKKLGVSKAHLSQIEKGHKFVSPERAYNFGKKLGYLPELFVQLSLQDQITKAKLPFKVNIQAA